MDLLQEAGHHHQEGEEGDPCQAEGVHPWEQEAVVQEVVPEALVLGLEDHQGVDPEVEEVLNGDFVSVIARKIYNMGKSECGVIETSQEKAICACSPCNDFSMSLFYYSFTYSTQYDDTP